MENKIHVWNHQPAMKEGDFHGSWVNAKVTFKLYFFGRKMNVLRFSETNQPMLQISNKSADISKNQT